MLKQRQDNTYPILMVEDDPDLYFIFGKILRDEGYSVVHAENGGKALELLEKNFYPIIISDWMMPVMDGLELCQKIRHMDLPGYVFFILLTVKNTKSEVVDGLESGADVYLTKPVIEAELLAHIRSGIRILNLEGSLKSATEAVKHLALTDTLTDSYNRNFMIQNLPGEIKKAHRYNYPLSIVMLDIDHFKTINDNYGHQAGDTALINCTNLIKSLIRSDIDWITRYGGDEMIVILPHIDQENAYLFAERIRLKLANTPINLGKKAQFHITASFGISTYHSTDEPDAVASETLLKEADQQLYIAKTEGRNTVRPILTIDKESTIERRN
ncbi:MAG: diguanylate cyclase [Chlamydiota bacterium]|nr:diguanylate cyclase [Chlamydiota bacterium]